jgi:hypothetical protein
VGGLTACTYPVFQSGAVSRLRPRLKCHTSKCDKHASCHTSQIKISRFYRRCHTCEGYLPPARGKDFPAPCRALSRPVAPCRDLSKPVGTCHDLAIRTTRPLGFFIWLISLLLSLTSRRSRPRSPPLTLNSFNNSLASHRPKAGKYGLKRMLVAVPKHPFGTAKK